MDNDGECIITGFCIATSLTPCHCAVVEVGLSPLHETVREGEGSARVNISILQGTLGDISISFIVSTTNGSAQGIVQQRDLERVRVSNSILCISGRHIAAMLNSHTLAKQTAYSYTTSCTALQV